MAESKLIRSVYDASPPFVQDVMASVAGYKKNSYRYGHPRWQHWLDHYTELNSRTDEQLREYQWSEVRRTLDHAYRTTPFYRDRFTELGLTPEDFQVPEDLQKLPYTTKDELRQHSDRLISEDYDRSTLNMDPTSGSTGQPLKLYNDREAEVRNYAVRWAQCRPNITRSMRYANFTGTEIVKPDCTQPPFWRMNYAAGQRLYSVFHMNDETQKHYVDNLNVFKPDWIYGYPSAIYTLADFMERHDLRLNHQIRAVVTSSEECLDKYRETIERVFETTLWDEYGQAEFAGLAFQCECGKMHENVSYSHIEFIPTGEEENGIPCCELICTSTINPAWPLIRYRVGDIALIDPDAKCPLGRPGRVIEKMHGRTANFLETADGRRISNISVMAKKCRNMKSCQAVQETAGIMKLRIVRDENFVDGDAAHAVKEFRKKIGGEDKMQIDIEYAEEPLLTKSGKFLMIVSKM